MKINHKILSVPPYISTSWKNISSLHLDEKQNPSMLVIVLTNGSRIEIPNLEKPIIEAIFDAHSKFLEHDPKKMNIDGSIGLGFPLKGVGGAGGGIEALGAAMQHNPEQANSPDIPTEVLNKIAGVARILGVDDPESLPKPEPHCNCFHCQIARTLQVGAGLDDENLEISEEDLKFKSWEVKQTDEKLYLVTNPLDEKEHYNVYLGEPIGCTCGQKNCDHIRAVLKT